MAHYSIPVVDYDPLWPKTGFADVNVDLAEVLFLGVA
jgi:hypothetical protein